MQQNLAYPHWSNCPKKKNLCIDDVEKSKQKIKFSQHMKVLLHVSIGKRIQSYANNYFPN